MKKFRFVVFCVVFNVVACGGKQKIDQRGSVTAIVGRNIAKEKPPKAKGLQIRLEATQPTAYASDRVALAKSKPLSLEETNALLERVTPIQSEEEDQKDFSLRSSSLPPPRTGATVNGIFPLQKKIKTPKIEQANELKIVRFSPEGEVKIAPKLSVTFSQPMVAVTSHADTIAKGVPVELSPKVQGQWRWIGTKTLLFEHKQRFPMATQFTVKIPAGIQSVLGGKLAKTETWTFTTPAPTVISQFPTNGPHKLDPVFFVGFDQNIDPIAVLKTITLSGNGDDFSLRMASKEEIDKEESIEALVKSSEKGRWLAFKAQKKLFSDTHFTVKVGPNTPSQEGPLKTKEPQSFSFKTYAPLAIERTNCTFKYPCRPPTYFSISFNNTLEEESVDANQIKIMPPISDMRVETFYSSISIYGNISGRTTYKVTLPATIKDIYGQRLGSSEKRWFVVGEAYPRLSSSGGRMVVLDPSGDKQYRVYSVNHDKLHVRIYSVKPKDWSAYLEYSANGIRQTDPKIPPGDLRFDKIIRVKGKPDNLVDTTISLKSVLNKEGHGQAIVLVTQTPLPSKIWERQYALTWVQATDLAVDAAVDHTKLLGWVTKLRNGSPVTGAKVSIVDAMASGKTDDKGMVQFPLPVQVESPKAVLVAQTSDDVVILPESQYPWGSSSWYKRSMPGESLRWYTFDDRKLYKPRETVQIKGWVRLVNMGSEEGIRLLPSSDNTISYQVFDSRRNKIATGTAKIGALGGFDFGFKLADNANLGSASVYLSAHVKGTSETSHTHYFKIQEFRRPEFEVNSKTSQGPHFVGGHADVSVTASYYAGGGLPDADLTWRVSTSDGFFTPPNQKDFTFVGWRPFWYNPPREVSRVTETFKGKTDSKGAHYLRVHFDSADPPRPMSVSATATVQDVNRQAWSTSSTMLVHPAKYYVGLKTDRYFVDKGQPLKVKTIVVDLDGKKIAAQKITMRAVRLGYRFEKKEWKQVELDPQSCTVDSDLKPVECIFSTDKGGMYLITATIQDNKGRFNETEMVRWVSGGKCPPDRNVKKEEVRIIADKDSYQPGDTAELLIQAPFDGAEGLMTLRRVGILEKQRFSIKETTTTLKIPIKEKYLPNLKVQIDLVGSAVRLTDDGEEDPKLPKRPAYASGEIDLSIPPLKRELSIDVKPRDAKIEPGGKTIIDLVVKDVDKKPISNSEVAVVVVDEAVLGLTGYKIESPLSVFYPHKYAEVSDYYLRSAVNLEAPEKLKIAMQSSMPPMVQRAEAEASDGFVGGARPPSEALAMTTREPMKKSAARFKNGGEGNAEQPIALRKDFSALALFVPAVRTNKDGKAEINLKVPDNLTRYRIMAVAVAQAKFYGTGESTVTARQPIMVRPSAPRFLNYGDNFEFPVVLQNQTDKPLDILVAVRASNLQLSQKEGQRITVPANDRKEVRFPAKTIMAGTARLQVAASSGIWSDAAEVSLPVWTPATTEAFATYGTIDKGATVQPVKMPSDVVTEFGGLQVSTSSTALSALTDALLYLYEYPYECSEQIASRILAVAALKDVLSAFKATGLPSSEKIFAALARDLKKLYGMQNTDGGFPFWQRGYDSWPFLSNHVTHALVRAKAKGFSVPEDMLRRALQHLKNIESYIPSYYSDSARRAVVAYSLYVRNLANDVDVQKAKRIFEELLNYKEVPLEGIAWIYPVLSGQAEAKDEISKIRRLLQNKVTETAAAAHFATSYDDSAYLLLYSDRRVDGLLLEALIKDQPKSDLIPKLVEGLLAHRKQGRWTNTQESSWVLLALDKYFNTYEKVTPNFVARVWLGDKFAGDHKFKGRTTERHSIDIPMQFLATAKGSTDLTLGKQGPGRLYYRIGMKYAPKDLRLPAADHGFTIQRRYESVDNPSDVICNKDGKWLVRAGSRVKVVVTMVAPTRRYHVALVDPLPAGLEAINADLKGSETQVDRPSVNTGTSNYSSYRSWSQWGWRSTWYEHQNLRDERAEAFASLLWTGVYTYSYLARATTPGQFVVPPPKAEEMYFPETFGRGAGDFVIVK